MKLQTLLLLSLPLAFASCGSSEEPAGTDSTVATPSSQAPLDLAAGAKFYAETCTPCHGATGHGDGAASASLVPKPRNLTDSAWQASIDDEYLRKIIQYGGAAVGKGATMPANPVLGSNPDLLNNLVGHIRSMAE